MLTALDFISKAVFEELTPALGVAVISIGDPASYPPAQLARYQRFLRLEFLDCERAMVEADGIPEEALCQLDQIAGVVDFVQSLTHSNQDWRLIVHCYAGSSRSAAVALLAHAMTDTQFPRHQDAHYANTHVVALGAALLGRPIAIPVKATNGEPHPYLRMTLQI